MSRAVGGSEKGLVVNACEGSVGRPNDGFFSGVRDGIQVCEGDLVS